MQACVLRYYELPVCCRALAEACWFAQLGQTQPQRHKAAFIHLLELLQHVCLLTEEPQKRYRPPHCKAF